MAITVVQSKATGAGASASLSIGSTTTAGNRVFAFLSQSASLVAPTVKDNEPGGSSGWTVSSTKAEGAAKANSLWVAEKKVASGEPFSIIEMTAGTSGIAQGICAFELAGASSEIDVSVKNDNPTTSKSVTSPAVTTTDSSDILLGAVGAVNAALSVTSWTASMTDVEPATGTRCMGGYYIPGTTLSGATFTANWETSRQVGMLVLAVKVAASGVVPSVMMV